VSLAGDIRLNFLFTTVLPGDILTDCGIDKGRPPNPYLFEIAQGAINSHPDWAALLYCKSGTLDSNAELVYNDYGFIYNITVSPLGKLVLGE
jgi:hypothetical protein